MAAEDPNQIAAEFGGRSTRLGDVPEEIKRRYFTDGRGGGRAYYLDAASSAPVFRDRGDRLSASRNDPNAIRHMVAIARHRQWNVIVVRGAPEFRREAWVLARTAELDVRGYRPTERDLQDLQRRLASTRARAPVVADERVAEARRTPDRHDAGARSRLRAAEAVIRARVSSKSDQERILAAARDRVGRWMERGAKFDPILSPEREAGRPRTRSR